MYESVKQRQSFSSRSRRNKIVHSVHFLFFGRWHWAAMRAGGDSCATAGVDDEKYNREECRELKSGTMTHELQESRVSRDEFSGMNRFRPNFSGVLCRGFRSQDSPPAFSRRLFLQHEKQGRQTPALN